MKHHEQRKLQDDQVRRILERAAELDGPTKGLTVGELRAAALDAGLSDEAVSAAVAEEFDDPKPFKGGSSRRLRDLNLGSVGAWLRSSVLLGTGSALAVFQSATSDGMEFLPVVLAGLAGVTVVIGMRRMDGRETSYWKRAPLTWVGYFATAVAAISVEAERLEPAAGTLMRPAVVVSIAALGTGVLAFRFLKKWRNGEPMHFAEPTRQTQ